MKPPGRHQLSVGSTSTGLSGLSEGEATEAEAEEEEEEAEGDFVP